MSIPVERFSRIYNENKDKLLVNLNDHSPDHDKIKEWIELQTTPFDKLVATKFMKYIRYISFDEFHEKFISSVEKYCLFLDRTPCDGRKIILYIPERLGKNLLIKSNFWLALIAWPYVKKYITNIVTSEGALISLTNKKIDPHGINRIVILDDMIYSGRQLAAGISFLVQTNINKIIKNEGEENIPVPPWDEYEIKDMIGEGKLSETEIRENVNRNFLSWYNNLDEEIQLYPKIDIVTAYATLSGIKLIGKSVLPFGEVNFYNTEVIAPFLQQLLESKEYKKFIPSGISNTATTTKLFSQSYYKDELLKWHVSAVYFQYKLPETSGIPFNILKYGCYRTKDNIKPQYFKDTILAHPLIKNCDTSLSDCYKPYYKSIAYTLKSKIITMDDLLSPSSSSSKSPKSSPSSTSSSSKSPKSSPKLSSSSSSGENKDENFNEKISRLLPEELVRRLLNREECLIKSDSKNRKNVKEILDSYNEKGMEPPYYIDDFIFSVKYPMKSDRKYTFEDIMEISDKEIKSCHQFFAIPENDPNIKERIANILKYNGLITQSKEESTEEVKDPDNKLFSVLVVSVPNYYVIRKLNTIPSSIRKPLNEGKIYLDDDVEEDFYPTFSEEEEEEIKNKHAYNLIPKDDFLKEGDPIKNAYKSYKKDVEINIEEIDYVPGEEIGENMKLKKDGIFITTDRYRKTGEGGSKTAWVIGDGLVLMFTRTMEMGNFDKLYKGWNQTCKEEVYYSQKFKEVGLLSNNSRLVYVYRSDAPDKKQIGFISDSFRSLREKGVWIVDRKGRTENWNGSFFTGEEDIEDINTFLPIMEDYLKDAVLRASYGFTGTGDSLSLAIIDGEQPTLRILSFDFGHGVQEPKFNKKSFIPYSIDDMLRSGLYELVFNYQKKMSKIQFSFLEDKYEKLVDKMAIELRKYVMRNGLKYGLDQDYEI